MHHSSSRPFIRSSSLAGAALVGAAFLAGCSGTAASGIESASLCSVDELRAANTAETRGLVTKGVAVNGWSLNGMRMNGLQLNGLQLNGLQLNGLQLNGLQLNGTVLQSKLFNGKLFNGNVLQGAKLNGPVLQGTSLEGGGLSGASLEGAELVGLLEDGSTIAIHLDRVLQNPEPAHADVVLYEVSYGAEHEPLCGRDAAGAPLLATALANTWDAATGARIDSPDRFTFACQGGALYKCVAAGYKPWRSVETAEGVVSLADYHQACTRMLRADYCGDGNSFTRDGTEIDIHDVLGVQTSVSAERPSFVHEAVWGPNGATCIAKTRFRLPELPQCVVDRMSDTCESLASNATLASAPSGVGLMNRSSNDNACLTP